MKFDYDFKNNPWYLNLLIFLGVLVFAIGIFFAIGWLFMSIWNTVIPSVFNLNTINLHQSIDLLLLVWLARLFSSNSFNSKTSVNWDDKN